MQCLHHGRQVFQVRKQRRLLCMRRRQLEDAPELEPDRCHLAVYPLILDCDLKVRLGVDFLDRLLDHPPVEFLKLRVHRFRDAH